MDENSVSRLISFGRDTLREASDTPQLDAEILLGKVIAKERLWLIAHSDEMVGDKDVDTYKEYLHRRAMHEPIAYIIGEKEFFGLNFLVSPAVLVPRPETEILVNRVLELLEQGDPLKILDLGTGSGCIPIAIAKNSTRTSKIIAIDTSKEALEVAKRNSIQHEVDDRIHFIESNWFSEVGEKDFDLILSNPPYVSRDESLAKDLSYEPEGALFSSDKGLEDIEKIIKESPHYLARDGKALIECGYEQSTAIRSLGEAHGFTVTFHRDLQGIERIAELGHRRH